MDPLTALGLAANIVQFLDFAGKLFSTTQQVWETGTSSNGRHLAHIVDDLHRVTSGLTTSLKSSDASKSVTEDDQAVRNLAVECTNICEDLNLRLNRLKVDADRKSKWKTFRAVMRAIWEEDKINKTYKRLDDIRNELSFRLAAITKKNVDMLRVTQDWRFAQLDQRTAIIIQKLIENPYEIGASIAAQTAQLQSRHDESDKLAVDLQRETIAAIDRLQAPFTSSFMPTHDRQRPISPRPRALTMDEAVTMLLDRLKFRQMHAREEEILDPHFKTFEWILSDATHNSERSFSPLRPWLERETGCYWVSGKAGSGKSTLMKMLGSSAIVKKVLKSWAGTDELVMASFYVWRGGTTLQRSQEGLLRWLLYSILSQRRDLAPICFPEITKLLEVVSEAEWDNILPQESDEQEGLSIIPTLENVKKMFALLATSELKSTKLFLLVDGLDEYEGDHNEICKFFKDLAQSAVFKILISSRPIPACADAFEKFPKLRLQDLTHKDISLFVSDQIGAHSTMELLIAEEPEQASSLSRLIVSKASGVFLWVRLVVKSLLDGLRNFDRIPDLRKRVDEFPAELGGLYMHMFRSMETKYQAHGARLLRMVHQSISVQQQLPLSVLQLSFADEENPMRLTRMASKLSEAKQLSVRCELMEGRLRSRCWGLIEAVQPDNRTLFSVSVSFGTAYVRLDTEVQVLHRSVIDFLLETEVWNTLHSLTPKFNPDQQLMASCLLQLKTHPDPTKTWPRIKEITRNCLAYCRLLEKSTGISQTAIIDQIYDYITDKDKSISCCQVAAFPELKSEGCGNVHDNKRPLPKWFAASLLKSGLCLYLAHLVQQDPSGCFVELDLGSFVPELIRHFISSQANVSSTPAAGGTAHLTPTSGSAISPEQSSGILRHLVRYMVNAKYTFSSLCAWRDTLRIARDFAEQDDGWIEDEAQYHVLKVLVVVIGVFLTEGFPVRTCSLNRAMPQPSCRTNFFFDFPDLVDKLLDWLKHIHWLLGNTSGTDASLYEDVGTLRKLIVELDTKQAGMSMPEILQQFHPDMLTDSYVAHGKFDCITIFEDESWSDWLERLDDNITRDADSTTTDSAPSHDEPEPPITCVGQTHGIEGCFELLGSIPGDSDNWSVEVVVNPDEIERALPSPPSPPPPPPPPPTIRINGISSSTGNTLTHNGSLQQVVSKSSQEKGRSNNMKKPSWRDKLQLRRKKS